MASSNRSPSRVERETDAGSNTAEKEAPSHLEGAETHRWDFLFLQWVPLARVCLPALRTDRLQKRLQSCKVCHTRFILKRGIVPELTGFRRPLGSAEARQVSARSIPGICRRLPRWGRAAGNGLSHPRRICSGHVGAALCRYRGVGYVKGIHLDDASLQGMTQLGFHKYIWGSLGNTL